MNRQAQLRRANLLLDPESRGTAIIDLDLNEAVEEPHLDAICRFVAGQCGTPMAWISLVDLQEQRFLAQSGTNLKSLPLATSLCLSAMGRPAITVVPDALADPRYAQFAIVTGPPHIRFYAAAPLVTAEGVPLGTLCVLDSAPRSGLATEQATMLRLMADAVMDRLTLRRVAWADLQANGSAPRRELRFRNLTDAMPQMVWSTKADGRSDYFNARWYEFTGLSEGECDGDEWAHSLHPDDYERTMEAWKRCVATGEPYEIEYRLRRADGSYRWVLARGLPFRDVEGDIVRWFGTCTDIHAQKLAIEERDIISQELNHRIKNIFAVISGLIGLATRGNPVSAAVGESLQSRILALGRAHEFVRSHGRDEESEPGTGERLESLLNHLFEPYKGSCGERVRVSGGDILVDDRSATPIALIFHELATNAAKYGALSLPGGHVDLTITPAPTDRLVIVWRETGGPLVEAPQSQGFGSQLLDLGIRRQLGGSYVQEWPQTGLVMTIEIPLSSFSRPTS